MVVSGRPQVLTLRLETRSGDRRYASLLGLVAFQETRLLPVGRHRLTLSGLDRADPPRPIRPGRYRLVVACEDDPIGPPPSRHGEVAPPPARVELTLVVTGPDHPAPRRREPAKDAAFEALLTDPHAPWPYAGEPSPTELAALVARHRNP